MPRRILAGRLATDARTAPRCVSAVSSPTVSAPCLSAAAPSSTVSQPRCSPAGPAGLRRALRPSAGRAARGARAGSRRSPERVAATAVSPATLAALRGVPVRRPVARSWPRRRRRRAGAARVGSVAGAPGPAAALAGSAGVRIRGLGDLLRRAGDDELATLVPALGAEVDDPVGHLDDVEVVLDHDDRVARVDEPLEHLEQPLDVGEVQAGRRLVQDVDRPAGRDLARAPRRASRAGPRRRTASSPAGRAACTRARRR